GSHGVPGPADARAAGLKKKGGHREATALPGNSVKSGAAAVVAGGPADRGVARGGADEAGAAMGADRGANLRRIGMAFEAGDREAVELALAGDGDGGAARLMARQAVAAIGGG